MTGVTFREMVGSTGRTGCDAHRLAMTGVTFREMVSGRQADPFSVQGRRIVIVGGTAGIGLAAAAHLARAGADVVITGRRASGHEIATGAGARFTPMDVASRDSVAAGFEDIAAGGGIDCLIHNAGIERYHGPLEDLNLDAFETVLDINTLGAARTLAHGISLMRSGGSIVVTSSPAGSITAPEMAAYSASKAALDMLVRTWALELGPRQIRINAVLPGIVESEMGSESAPDAELIRRMTANGALRRGAELGPVFQFLASDASITLTGSLVGAHDGILAGYSREVLERLGADLA